MRQQQPQQRMLKVICIAEETVMSVRGRCQSSHAHFKSGDQKFRQPQSQQRDPKLMDPFLPLYLCYA